MHPGRDASRKKLSALRTQLSTSPPPSRARWGPSGVGFLEGRSRAQFAGHCSPTQGRADVPVGPISIPGTPSVPNRRRDPLTRPRTPAARQVRQPSLARWGRAGPRPYRSFPVSAPLRLRGSPSSSSRPILELAVGCPDSSNG
jgi:hypothetical protein